MLLFLQDTMLQGHLQQTHRDISHLETFLIPRAIKRIRESRVATFAQV